MATLVVRDLDPDVKERLRRRAAAHGRSMEAEARAVLAEAVSAARPSRGLGSFVHEQFAACPVDLPVPPRHDDARAADLR